MPLKINRRKDTGALTITGTVRFPDGTGQRVRTRAQSDDFTLAREEAAALEAKMLRDAWHGERRGTRTFGEAVIAYLESEPRSTGTKARLNRLLRAVGDRPLSAINQETATRARQAMLAPDAAPATIRRGVIVPLRAVVLHAHRLGWCDAPHFQIPREPQGRTRYLLPTEAERLILAAAAHLKPLLIFLLCTGARMSEALELEWRDVDLVGGRAIFWRTKGGRRRVASLPGRAVGALAAIGGRSGSVFLTQHDLPYADRNRDGGGQIKTAWRGARSRAAIDPLVAPHDLRHTWASWHYAVHRDLLSLKLEGGWSSVALVERYAHLMPAGHETEIKAFWHGRDTSEIDEVISA
jgi:integrase